MSLNHFSNSDSADAEITIRAGNLNLRVSAYGASLRGLWREESQAAQQDIITGYTGAKNKMGGQGDVLIPFPGRVRDGQYTFDGETYQMERNDKEGPSAIHGFLRQIVWDVVEQSKSAITFRSRLNPDDHAGYPFSLEATVTYLLDSSGLTCRFTVTNTGTHPAPVAAGFHPYFTVGSDTTDADLLSVPMDSFLEFDAVLIPTGRVLPVEGTAYDFRTPRPIGTDTVFNTCYLNPQRDADGLVRIRLEALTEQNSEHSSGRALSVWMDSAFNAVVLYSGDPLPTTHRRRALAIEPMTCGADAFNHPEWGLVALEPGQTLSGAWGVVTTDR